MSSPPHPGSDPSLSPGSVPGSTHAPAPEGSDDAVGAEAMQTLLRGHGVLEHIQADGTHELTVQAPGGHHDLQAICDGFLAAKKGKVLSWD